MRNTTRLGLTLLLGAGAILAVACGDDASNPNPGSTAGNAGTPAGGSDAGQAGKNTAGSNTMAGGGNAGTSTTAGTGGTGGDVGGTAGAGGTTAGTAGTAAGMAGTGGTPEPIKPTLFWIDNFRLQKKGPGGEGGSGGDGAGGEPAVVAPGAEGGAGGAGGEGNAPEPDHSFNMTFDANVGTLAVNMYGFSPNVGGTAGPAIIQDTTFLWDAAVGKTGGGVKMSIPFSVKFQQTDVMTPFAVPANLTGYEVLADVQLKETGTAGDCPTVWLYAWGGGYANDKTGEPMTGVTQKLTKGQWTTVRLDMDGPYGIHSTANFPTYKPTEVVQVGMQMVTFGCP